MYVFKHDFLMTVLSKNIRFPENGPMTTLKRNHFKGKDHLSPSHFSGDMLVFGGVGPVEKKTHNFVAFARWAPSPIINGVSHEGRRNLCSQHRVWVNPPPPMCASGARLQKKPFQSGECSVILSLEAQIREFLPNLGLVFRPPIVQTRACGPVMCHLGHFTCPSYHLSFRRHRSLGKFCKMLLDLLKSPQ